MGEGFAVEVDGVGSTVVAKFWPMRVDDLKPDAVDLIGRTGVFEALWQIEDGPYKDQWAMRIPQSWPIESAFWVPQCDLRIVFADRAA